MATLLEYRLRVRNAADSADALSITSVRGDTAPYIESAPSGDGTEFDPLSGAFRSGSMVVRIVDAITSGADRLISAQLEDANYRQQLAGRVAYVEYRENGGAWTVMQPGIVTAIRLASAIVYEIEVGDTMRATRNLVAFAPKRKVGDNTKVERLSTFLARWPVRGCLVGGPIRGGFLRQVDLGGWEMRVVSTQGAGANIVKGLAFVSGYIAPEFKRTTDVNAVRDTINRAVGDPTAGGADSTFPEDLPRSIWPDLVVQVDSAYYAAAYFGQSLVAITPSPTFIAPTTYSASIYVMDPTNALTVGSTIVKVRVFDALPSDRCPIYYTGHPVDLFTALCDEAGLSYDASAVTTAKNTLGTSLRINLRITSQEALDSFLESVLYGPVGFSARTNASAQLVPFVTRIMTSTAPAVTISSADVPQDDSALFDLSEPDAVTKVVYSMQNLLTTFSTSDISATGRTAVSTGASSTSDSSRYAIPRTTAAPDGVEVQNVRVERTSGDSAAAVQREQSYSLPGFLDYGKGSYDPGIVDARAKEIFDRQSRGRLSGEITLLRGGAGSSLVLGDEFLNALPAMPNKNKRLGDDNSVGGRAVQIVRATPTPTGWRVRYLDSGPAAQTISTVPTLSLAAGTALGSVDVTITNAAVLNAAGYGARVQWAQSAGAAPASSEYTDAIAFAPGTIPTTAFTLTGATPGYTAYVKARSEAPNSRPTSYSAASSQATSAIAAPSALTATPSGTDGSQCTLAWTAGATTGGILTDVFLRLSASAASADVRQITLVPGSVKFVLEGLTPGTSYTASVQHREPATGFVSSKTTVTFTAGATTVTLAAPTYAAGFSGTRDPITGVPARDGVYGIGVVASSYPGFIEIAVAVETSVGAGTYGAYTTKGTIPAVLGNWSAWQDLAPNDGLRRSLKARHVRSGATSSSYTTPVIVDPWTPTALPAFPITAFFDVSTSESGSTGTLTVVVTDPLSAIDTTNRIKFTKLELGTRTTGIAPTTSPSAGVTAGTYTYSFTLDEKHPITIGAQVYYRDGTSPIIAERTFDFDKLANVINLDIATDATQAHVTVTADSDTATGANKGEYSINGGAWTGFTIGANIVGSFDVTMTAVTQALRVRVKDAAGTAGPIVEGTIPILGGGPTIDVRLVISATQYQLIITVAATDRIWYRLDSDLVYTNIGASGPQTVTLARNAAGGAPRPMSWKAIDVNGVESQPWTGVVMPQDATPSTGTPGFSSVSFSGSPDYVNDRIDIAWVPDNAPVGATYNVTIYEQTHPTHTDRGKVFEAVNVTSPYTYQCQNDIDSVGLGLTKYFTAYVSMISGFSVVVDSATVAVTLNSNT